MELTKDECLEALIELTPDPISIFSDDVITIQNLIKEHFDNQPLKFEELKEDMWVWDNKEKSYIFIYKPLDWAPIKGIRYATYRISNSVDGYYKDFEEGRFFAREVKE